MAIKDFIDTMAFLQPIPAFTRLLSAEHIQSNNKFFFFQEKNAIGMEFMISDVNTGFP